MVKNRRIAILWILLTGGFSILWGMGIARTGNQWVDFRAIYFGSRCLIDHQNPYNVSELESVYRTEGGAGPRNRLKFTRLSRFLSTYLPHCYSLRPWQSCP